MINVVLYANNKENENYQYKFVSIYIVRRFMDILVGVYYYGYRKNVLFLMFFRTILLILEIFKQQIRFSQVNIVT